MTNGALCIDVGGARIKAVVLPEHVSNESLSKLEPHVTQYLLSL